MSAIAKSLWYPMPNAQSCTQVILGPLRYLLYCLVSTFIARIRKGRSEDTTDFSDTDLLFDLNSTRSSNATTKMLSAKPMPVLFFFFQKIFECFSSICNLSTWNVHQKSQKEKVWAMLCVVFVSPLRLRTLDCFGQSVLHHQPPITETENHQKIKQAERKPTAGVWPQRITWSVKCTWAVWLFLITF